MKTKFIADGASVKALLGSNLLKPARCVREVSGCLESALP